MFKRRRKFRHPPEIRIHGRRLVWSKKYHGYIDPFEPPHEPGKPVHPGEDFGPLYRIRHFKKRRFKRKKFRRKREKRGKGKEINPRNVCIYCGTKDYLPYQCNYCGQNFCYEHRLPPNHNCTNIKSWESYSGPSSRPGEKRRSWKAGGELIQPKREVDGLPKREDYKKSHRLGRIVKVSIAIVILLIALEYSGVINVSEWVSDIWTPQYLPIANFTMNPTDNIRAYDTIQFTDISVDDYGTIQYWCWNFGDETENVFDQNPTHTYLESSTYKITLTIQDNNGKTASYSKFVDIWSWVGEDGESIESFVWGQGIFGKGIVVGADGHKIRLHNNPYANDPSWNELLQFLRQDTTDQIPYSYSSFVCADYAEKLHNNAEEAGIRAAYVDVFLKPYYIYNIYTDVPLAIPDGIGHACDAFRTDRGIVFIDVTGSPNLVGYDKQVNIVVGGQYVPVALFSGDVEFYSMGIIDSYEVQW